MILKIFCGRHSLGCIIYTVFPRKCAPSRISAPSNERPLDNKFLIECPPRMSPPPLGSDSSMSTPRISIPPLCWSPYLHPLVVRMMIGDLISSFFISYVHYTHFPLVHRTFYLFVYVTKIFSICLKIQISPPPPENADF